MKEINLRDYYPYYTEDKFIKVPDEVAELLEKYERQEQSYKRMVRRRYTFSPFDFEKDLERLITSTQSSPCDILVCAHDKSILYKGLISLPEKQLRRLYLHYFLGLSVKQIAEKEGVHRSRIDRSIKAGIRALGNFFEEFSK